MYKATHKLAYVSALFWGCPLLKRQEPFLNDKFKLTTKGLPKNNQTNSNKGF